MRGEERADFGYDFWYQPYHNVMIGTEFGAPKFFFQSIKEEHYLNGGYGTHLNVYDWKNGVLKQKIDLGPEGVMPLEIRGAIQYSPKNYPDNCPEKCSEKPFKNYS